MKKTKIQDRHNRLKEPAYKDRKLTDRPGEQWDDIQGLDGYYQVSSYGRIKRMERETIIHNGGVWLLPEKIIAPRIMKTHNKLINDYKYHLAAHLAIKNVRFHLMIRRLVYHCFVKPLTLDEDSVYIVSKNGNGLDIRPDNLLMIEKISLAKRIYEQKRMVSSFKGKDNSKGTKASLKVTCKKISQYDAKGKRVKTFVSTMEAHRQTGLSHGHIGNAANGREFRAGGFFWRYGNAKNIDIKSLFEKKQQSRRAKRGTKVSQYDLDGNFIRYYPSLVDAAEAVKEDYSNISANIRGFTKTAFGYRWQKGYSKRKLKSL